MFWVCREPLRRAGMANMSYCRFCNTLGDLWACMDHLDDTDLSEEEVDKRLRLVQACRSVAEDYPEDGDLGTYEDQNRETD